MTDTRSDEEDYVKRLKIAYVKRLKIAQESRDTRPVPLYDPKKSVVYLRNPLSLAYANKAYVKILKQNLVKLKTKKGFYKGD